MNKIPSCLALVCALLLLSCNREEERTFDYPITGLSPDRVEITGGFWAPVLRTSYAQTLPHSLLFCEETGRIENFSRAAGLSGGSHQGERYNDSDLYKIIEGASHYLRNHQDQELEALIDSLVTLIAAAQEKDGYLFTSRTIDPERNIPGTGKDRWDDVWISHELYNAGHMYEAAVAWYEATGKTDLLDVAVRNADLVVSVFNERGLKQAPGHPEIELGLVKLYQATGEGKYLEQALFFLDQRGREVQRAPEAEGSRFEIYNEPSYLQSHLPVRQQKEAVGHAVRAMYLYAGMCDVGTLTRDSLLLGAVRELWNDVMSSKVYITGGIGASHRGEAFSEPFVLPNESAYCETCAAAGALFWNHRMFHLTGEPKYMDALEIVLYNGFLAGVSLDGKRFFYPNPLESSGNYTRSEWFGVACCPGNVARVIPSLPGYIYSRTEDTLLVNLYVESRAEAIFSGTVFRFGQITEYPREGIVRFRVSPEKPARLAVRFRIPCWTGELFMPGGLYTYTDRTGPQVQVFINGEWYGSPAGGKLVIERLWTDGDEVRLVFPMPVRMVRADDRIEADRGKVALVRGPLVYAAEGIDNGGSVMEVQLNGKESGVSDSIPGLPERIIGVRCGEFSFIPYFAWDNRGLSEMRVWCPLKSSGTDFTEQ